MHDYEHFQYRISYYGQEDDRVYVIINRKKKPI